MTWYLKNDQVNPKRTSEATHLLITAGPSTLRPIKLSVRAFFDCFGHCIQPSLSLLEVGGKVSQKSGQFPKADWSRVDFCTDNCRVDVSQSELKSTFGEWSTRKSAGGSFAMRADLGARDSRLPSDSSQSRMGEPMLGQRTGSHKLPSLQQSWQCAVPGKAIPLCKQGVVYSQCLLQGGYLCSRMPSSARGGERQIHRALTLRSPPRVFGVPKNPGPSPLQVLLRLRRRHNARPPTSRGMRVVMRKTSPGNTPGLAESVGRHCYANEHPVQRNKIAVLVVWTMLNFIRSQASAILKQPCNPCTPAPASARGPRRFRASPLWCRNRLR